MAEPRSRTVAPVDFQPDLVPGADRTGAPLTATGAPGTRRPRGFFRRHATALRIIGILGVMVLSVAGIIGFLIPEENSDEFRRELRSDTVKFLLQFVIITVIGGFVPIVVGEVNRHRDRKLAVRRFRRGIYDRLKEQYTNVKRIRRALRGQCTLVGQDVVLPFETYKAMVLELNEAQLEIEELRREVTLFKDEFEDPNPLIDDLRLMDTYLSEIFEAYESRWKWPNGKTPDYSVDADEALRRFLGLRTPRFEEARVADPTLQKGSFRVGFAGPYFRATFRLQKERLSVA